MLLFTTESITKKWVNKLKIKKGSYVRINLKLINVGTRGNVEITITS